MRLEALTFDFWGTLYQNAYGRSDRLRLLKDALENYGYRAAPEELDAAYRHARSVWDQVWREERRSISIDRWVDELLGYVDAELPEEAEEALGRAMEAVYLRSDEPRPVPGVTEVVPRLAERFRLGLISDTGLTPGRVLRQVMDRDGLLSSFDALTFSDELGTAKPQPEPFLRTLRLLDAIPEQAAHIGDLPETDLRGAREVGMRVILFLGVSHREDGRELADGIFEDYGELEELLDRVGRV
jgi:putative hydrolase of the HAD superfamily